MTKTISKKNVYLEVVIYIEEIIHINIFIIARSTSEIDCRLCNKIFCLLTSNKDNLGKNVYSIYLHCFRIFTQSTVLKTNIFLIINVDSTVIIDGMNIPGQIYPNTM